MGIGNGIRVKGYGGEGGRGTENEERERGERRRKREGRKERGSSYLFRRGMNREGGRRRRKRREGLRSACLGGGGGGLYLKGTGNPGDSKGQQNDNTSDLGSGSPLL